MHFLHWFHLLCLVSEISLQFFLWFLSLSSSAFSQISAISHLLPLFWVFCIWPDRLLFRRFLYPRLFRALISIERPWGPSATVKRCLLPVLLLDVLFPILFLDEANNITIFRLARPKLLLQSNSTLLWTVLLSHWMYNWRVSLIFHILHPVY